MVTSRLWLVGVVLMAGAAFGAGSTIEVAGKPVDLATLKSVEVTRPDIQAAGQAHYRGVSLSTVLATVKAPATTDTVLLRFANGMQVPLPRDPKQWRELDPFIALSVERDGVWSAAFPQVTKPGAEERDARPLVFNGNKFVVSTTAHPAVPEVARLNGFTPFAYVDSLVAVELVSAAQRELALKGTSSEAARDGFKVFLGRCQFCHGVKLAGAKYGPDFALPGFADKDARELLLHVRYRDRDAAEKGLMMPFFKDVSGEDIKSLLTWLRALPR